MRKIGKEMEEEVEEDEGEERLRYNERGRLKRRQKTRIIMDHRTIIIKRRRDNL